MQRYGDAFADRLHAMFTEAGLPFSRELEKVPNSRRALMIAELARDRGLHDKLHPRLFDAYWVHGRDLGDDDVLLEEGRAAGLAGEEITAVLTDSRYLERISEQTIGATALGVGGVPAWVIDERLLIPGAQPHGLFDQVLQRLGHEPIE